MLSAMSRHILAMLCRITSHAFSQALFDGTDGATSRLAWSSSVAAVLKTNSRSCLILSRLPLLSGRRSVFDSAFSVGFDEAGNEVELVLKAGSRYCGGAERRMFNLSEGWCVLP